MDRSREYLIQELLVEVVLINKSVVNSSILVNLVRLIEVWYGGESGGGEWPSF